jgi:hypothetical protein
MVKARCVLPPDPQMGLSIWVPLAMAGVGSGTTYGAYRYYALRRKIMKTPDGAEAQFTEKKAKVIEWILRKLPKDE